MLSKILCLLPLITLLSSCALIHHPPIGMLNNDKTKDISSNVVVYAKLIYENDGYKLTSFCSNFGSNHCSGDINDPWNGYINLNNLSPVFRTNGMLCESMLFEPKINKKPVSSCAPAPYWEAPLDYSAFAQYLFVLPAIVLYTRQEVYLNYDKLNTALSDADSKINRSSIISRYENQLAQIEKAKLLEEQREEKRKEDERKKRQLHKQKIENNFKVLASLPKSVGDQVCDAENHYGYIEQVKDSQLKIQLVGKAINENQYFFFDKSGRFSSQRQNNIIWRSSKDWALCSFDEIN